MKRNGRNNRESIASYIVIARSPLTTEAISFLSLHLTLSLRGDSRSNLTHTNMQKHYYIYMTNKINTVLYTGITNNLKSRTWKYKNKIVKGFTAKYNVNKLVYYEEFDSVENAILYFKRKIN